MRVLYIIPYSLGGMAHYTAELANAVSQYAEVYILANKEIDQNYFNNSVNLVRIFDNLNVNLSNLKCVCTYDNIKSLLSYKNVKIINKIKPSIIHITTPLVFPLPLFMKFYQSDKNCPIMFTNHYIHQDAGPLIERISHLQCFFDRLINYDKIIVHTESDRNLLIDHKIFDRDDITIIPHGVYRFFTKLSPTNINDLAHSKENIILFFGYIRQYKGIDLLLKSLYRIKDEIKDVKLILAGEGDLNPYIDVIDDLKPAVEVHNAYISDKDVAELFCRASVVVLPYIQMSGQSGIINVAFAFGKPVVATDVCGLNEIIENNITGLLVPPNNSELLAEAIIKLLKNEKLRHEFGNNILKKASDLSWNNIAEKHIEVYEQVIADFRY